MERRQQTPRAIFTGKIELKTLDTWVACYAELVDTVLNIYKNGKYNECLELGNDTVFNRKDKKEQYYEFEIRVHINKSNKVRKFLFRTQKHYDREMWRGYIVGITKGKIPSDLDIGRNEIKELEHKLAIQAETKMRGARPTSDYHSMAPSNVSGSSTGSFGVQSRASGNTSGHLSMTDSVSMTGGGPTVKHKFYRTNDPREGQDSPSWFFSRCSRELAEQILVSAGHCGNTLMRESTHHMNYGSYVLTKLIDSNSKVYIEHYEVIRTSQGYQIKIQDVMETSSCLNDVMTLFKKIAGPDTKPLADNTLKNYGIHHPEYVTLLSEPGDGCPEDPDVDYREKARDYEIPNAKFRKINKKDPTVSPGISKNTKFLPPEIERLDQIISCYDQLENINKSSEKSNKNSKGKQSNKERPLPPLPCPCSGANKYQSIADTPPSFPDNVRLTQHHSKPAIMTPDEKQKIKDCVKEINVTKPVQVGKKAPQSAIPSSVPTSSSSSTSSTELTNNYIGKVQQSSRIPIFPPHAVGNFQSPSYASDYRPTGIAVNRRPSNSTGENINMPGPPIAHKTFRAPPTAPKTFIGSKNIIRTCNVDQDSGGSIDTTSTGSVQDVRKKLIQNNSSTAVPLPTRQGWRWQ